MIQLLIEESPVCFVRFQTNRTFYLQARSFSFEVQRLTKENMSRQHSILSPAIELFASLRWLNFDKTQNGNNQIARLCVKARLLITTVFDWKKKENRVTAARSPLLGAYNSHSKPMQRHFYRPVYFYLFFLRNRPVPVYTSTLR